ncbi:2-oxo-4-hydroxy-4-carboxy-5-ureidoimidazoline decarboxylase [Pseudocolwellia agarivorans]|uniref:2-oxo-4-hydroxy-4-carboxy-5-ureidoimidazoline decarboxylase n=1 Tax=Pseudocolwellia agarivorans TaxID=1911682 RepID=UPI003F8808A6
MNLTQLTQLNEQSKSDAYQALESCCVAPRWVEAMVAARPFSSHEEVYQTAQKIWDELNEDDYLAAFEGHPQIGDVSTLRAKFAATAEKAGHEQSGMSAADENVLQDMMATNKAYLENFGFIFIVCATGKSAEQMLALIKERINNDRDTELAIAANEQAKITKIRLEKLL